MEKFFALVIFCSLVLIGSAGELLAQKNIQLSQQQIGSSAANGRFAKSEAVLSRPRAGIEKFDLNEIVGRCGCEHDRRLVHNDPFKNDQDEAATQFNLPTRWGFSSLSGGGLGQGDATMLSWSIVPDGTDANGGGGFVASNLISTFDNLFNEPNAGSADLTNRFWFSLIEQALDRWGEVSGIEYVYEPNDDGSANFGFGGFVGVRGDVRIGGFNIDGSGGTLAFNSFPNVGDMAIDTTDTGLFGSGGAGFRLFRNVFTHEQGHGIGIAHVQSNNAGFLMEPFISGAFDGPQLDDIRAAHRGYGDVLEKQNNFAGNNSIANATDLGIVSPTQSISIGNDGSTGTVVGGNDDDFISIDDNNDTDFFSFTIDQTSFVDIVLAPVGAPYNQSPEGGAGATPINPTASSNLTLALFNSAGSMIQLVNDNPAGQNESILDELLPAGEYFVRATGTANTIQLYTLDMSAEEAEPTTLFPTVFATETGSIRNGGILQLAVSDDQYLNLQADQAPSADEEPLIATFTIISPNIGVSQLGVEIESAGNTPNLSQSLSVFSVLTGTFVEIDASDLTTDDSTITLELPGDPQQYVNPLTGNILVQVRYEETGLVLIYPWTVSIDRITADVLN